MSTSLPPPSPPNTILQTIPNKKAGIPYIYFHSIADFTEGGSEKKWQFRRRLAFPIYRSVEVCGDVHADSADVRHRLRNTGGSFDSNPEIECSMARIPLP